MNDKSGLSTTLYDRNGNMTSSINYHTQDRVRYEYDENNRLIKMKYPNNIVVSYTCDENGNIKTVTDKDGLKTTYTYDENDNEVIRTTGLIETNKRYDADNRLIRIKNEHRFTGELIDEYSYMYDSNNNIIEEIKRELYKSIFLYDIICLIIVVCYLTTKPLKFINITFKKVIFYNFYRNKFLKNYRTKYNHIVFL